MRLERFECARTSGASGYVVVLSSVLKSRAVTLVFCYLADLGEPTAVSHMRLAPGRAPQGRAAGSGGLPGQSHARACLLDHAAQLRDALGELLDTEEVSVELAEQTLEQAAQVWNADGG